MQDTEQKTTPFHRGEVAIQKRYGVDRVTHEIAKQVIRDYMREQHRQFFAKLPFILVGSVDDAGQPWASILMGEPGFISSPDEHTLTISSQPLYGDPLADVLSTTDAAGRDIGLLGIMLDRSRRNRLNGQISDQTESGFSVQVTQSFGNCPKYIQQRELKPKATAGGTIGGITATKNIVSGASLTPAWNSWLATVTRSLSLLTSAREIPPMGIHATTRAWMFHTEVANQALCLLRIRTRC